MTTLSQPGKSEMSGTRYPEMQDPLDRAIYHPIAGLFARWLSPTPVTPNMVSVAGGAAVAFAGAIYVGLEWPMAAVFGLLMHMAWHVLDGADGDLARLTGKSSPQGEIVDGICDYLGHIALYCALAGSLFGELGWVIWALAISAGASRIVQANFYESQRRQYLEWVYGVPWLKTKQTASSGSRFKHLGDGYLWLAKQLMPNDVQVSSAFDDQNRSRALQTILQDLGPKSLSGSGLLGANYRTLALGVSMLAGSPIWYFVYEIVFLNLVLVGASLKARQTLLTLRAEV